MAYPKTVKSTLRSLVPLEIRKRGWHRFYMWRDRSLQTIVSGDPAQKWVALTFDDGPQPGATPHVLEILDRYSIKASFFILGNLAEDYPEWVCRVYQAGHFLGNHTYSHRRLVGCSIQEIYSELSRCQKAVRRALGNSGPTTGFSSPMILRPPYGDLDATAFITARIMGYSIVNWSAAGEDWVGREAAEIQKNILADIRPGGILLLHDGWSLPKGEKNWHPNFERMKERSSLLSALPGIIETLLDQGYHFVTLGDLLRREPLGRRSWFAG